MTTSEQGIELIKSFEGYREQAYQDAIGIWTVGYGSTKMPDGSKVKKGDHLNQGEATEHLKKDVLKFERQVEGLVRVGLSQKQFDALVSFTYNVGAGNLKRSTLLRKLNTNPEDLNIAGEFCKWHKASGKPLLGLLRRRIKEAELYFS